MTPQADPVLDLFRETGAYLQGHFRLTSGLHSAEYLQCALVLSHPAAAEKLGRLLAEDLRKILDEPPALVVSPALGGLIIGHEVARAFNVPFLFTERDPETRKMSLRRGFSVRPGDPAVVVEDVITTGGSTQDVIEVLSQAGARVLAAGSIVDRSGGRVQLSVPRSEDHTSELQSHVNLVCRLLLEKK